MSLDFSLLDDDGREVFTVNVTHNLGKMAEAAGVYKCLWRPDENGFTKASDIIPVLMEGMMKLSKERERMQEFNPPNGWGSWDSLINFCAKVVVGCVKNPDARIDVCR